MEIGNVKADVNLVLNLREAERHRRYFDCFIDEKLLYRNFVTVLCRTMSPSE